VRKSKSKEDRNIRIGEHEIQENQFYDELSEKLYPEIE
jgi:hypothetical protein